MNVHKPVRKLSARQILIIGGALAAVLAGLDVGAQSRPVAALAGQTLGPRMDFDFAAHALPPKVAPPRRSGFIG
jgi:hypothetical protein